MDFQPNNPIVKLCLQGMTEEDKGLPQEARRIFLQAWNEATNDFEKYLAAHYLSRHQKTVSEKLKWLETTLEFALKVNNESVNGALPSLYSNLAKAYEESGETEKAKSNAELAKKHSDTPTDKGPFYHGTKADLKIGDQLIPGFNSNYRSDLTMNHIYFTALLNGAGLAADLVKGDAPGRVYIVEPEGSFENDPNVTDKKFPGNPTRSYRTTGPLKITGEVKEWLRQTPEQLKQWREKLENNKGEIIN